MDRTLIVEYKTFATVLCNIETERLAVLHVPEIMSVDMRRFLRAALDHLLFSAIKENNEWVSAVFASLQTDMLHMPTDLLQIITYHYLYQNRSDLVQFVCLLPKTATGFWVAHYEDEFLELSDYKSRPPAIKDEFKISMREAWQLLIHENKKTNSQALRVLMCAIYCEGGVYQPSAESYSPITQNMMTSFARSAFGASIDKKRKTRADSHLERACLHDELDRLARISLRYPSIATTTLTDLSPHFYLQDWVALLGEYQ